MNSPNPLPSDNMNTNQEQIELFPSDPNDIPPREISTVGFDPTTQKDWKFLFILAVVFLFASIVFQVIVMQKGKVVDDKVLLQINSSIGMLDFYPRIESGARIMKSTNVDFGVYDITIKKF